MDNDYCLAFIFDCNGDDTPAIKINNEPEQIAAFIAKTANASETMIIKRGGDLLLKTLTGFIFKCPDQEFLSKELLPVLVPMQREEVPIPTLKVLFDDWFDEGEEVDAERCKSWLKENRNIEL